MPEDAYILVVDEDIPLVEVDDIPSVEILEVDIRGKELSDRRVTSAALEELP